MDKPQIIVLTPVYNEEASLDIYRDAVRSTLLSRTDVSFRVLFIEDGSKDKSWEKIQDICRADNRFSGIRLSRNFGSHVAISAGLQLSRGDAYATLACDLQDPPETILSFVEKWREGAQIVWGKRASRGDVAWRRWTSRTFFEIIRRYAMPSGSRFTTGSFLLIDEKVAECFRRFKEHNRITFALVAWTGFDQVQVPYDRRQRERGVSGWNFGRMIKAMYDTFVGFSYLPIRLITWMGMFISLGISLPFLLYLIGTWATGHPIPGWTSMMFVSVFFFGVQFFIMGIVGEYLYRIYMETTGRPLYFISSKIGADILSDTDRKG
ncbi:MAG: glycosyltransferase family 2 protein [Nitrospinae bacterium]|nr:glycosyltransferase family 2 protein [Nitrospinota bacterium]MBF0634417.1 glycosyltransferase family 2 protein [Nitrospinota bacterium]